MTEYPTWVDVDPSHVVKKTVLGNPIPSVSVADFPDFNYDRQRDVVSVLVHNEEEKGRAISKLVPPPLIEVLRQRAAILEEIDRVHHEVEQQKEAIRLAKEKEVVGKQRQAEAALAERLAAERKDLMERHKTEQDALSRKHAEELIDFRDYVSKEAQSLITVSE